LLPSGDVEAFAVSIAVLLDDPKRLSWMGMNSRERALRHFSEGVVGFCLREFYQSLNRQPADHGFEGASFREDKGFEDAAQETIQAALAKGCRSLEQEFKARLANADKEIQLLRGYFDESQAEILRLRAALEREKGKNLWQYFKDRLSRLAH
jgi:hypothetical protein